MKPSLLLFFVPALIVGACSSSNVDTAADAGSGEAGIDGAAAQTDAASEAAPGDASGDTAACMLVRPYSTKTPKCNTCAEQECCALLNTCLNDDGCDNGYVDCILACALTDPGDAGPDADVDAGIAACETACGTQYPTGRDEYVAATACVDAKCSASCN